LGSLRYWALVAIGWVLVLAGMVSFIDVGYQNASMNFPAGGPEATGGHYNLLGWGTLLLGAATLASSHYFKLREARRLDRMETREIHDRGQRIGESD
jgi:hypothetical protein